MYALTEPTIDARTQLETDGYTLLRGALPPEEVADLRMAVDDVWRRQLSQWQCTTSNIGPLIS